MLPITHTIDISTLPAAGHTVSLATNEMERDQIKQEFDLLSVEEVKVDLRFKRWQRDGVKVEGKLKAKIEQACSVTLEPLPAIIDETFEMLFLPENGRFPKREAIEEGELILDFEGDDMPEVFNGRTLECMDIVIEQLALMIDPYPRKEGVSLASDNDAMENASEADEEPSPFAVLSKLKPQGNA